MKKIFYILLAVFVLTSCNTQFQLSYKVNVKGDADGNVNVQFPQGYLDMNGKADLTLVAGDTVPLTNNVKTKKQVLEGGSKKEISALEEVNNSMANQYNATAASGTYDLLIQGVVTEEVTGLSFVVNKHLTNRSDTTANVMKRMDSNDKYPYVQ